jgi:predicted N-acetyltransferase YhbS
VSGWPPGESDLYLPILLDTHDRQGYFEAAFDGDRLAGVAVVDPRPRGAHGELVQLEFFHVSRPYRKAGLGSRLFESAKVAAVAFGARGLYISATPSENTVNFYRAKGCVLSPQPDPELFALEPEDIHLELHFDER